MQAKKELNVKKNKHLALIIICAFLMLAVALCGLIYALTPKTIIVRCKVNGTWQNVRVNSEATGKSLSEPDKIYGYDFDGWFKDPALALPIDVNEKLIEGSQYFAKFSPKKIVVEYLSNLEDGLFSSQEVYYDTDYELIENPFNNSSYDFKGWSKSNNTKWSEPENIESVGTTETLKTETITYYAVWQGKQKLTINFNKLDAEDCNITLDTENFYYGDDLLLKQIPEAEINNITNKNNAFVKFGGYKIDNKEYPVGHVVKNVKENIEVKINWVSVDNILYYNLNLGSMVGNESYDQVVAPETKKVPAKEYSYKTKILDNTKFNNYRFVGWNTKPDGTGTFVAASGTFTTSGNLNNTLYAMYEGNRKTIFINSSDVVNSTIPAKLDCKFGDAVRFPNYTIERMKKIKKVDDELGEEKFSGFVYTNSNNVKTIVLPGETFLYNVEDDSLTFSINWQRTEILSTLYFNLNLPKNETLNQDVTELLAQREITTKPTQATYFNYVYENIPNLNNTENYMFVKWASREDGSGDEVYANTTYLTRDDMNTLYAVWVGNYIGVNKNFNDATGTDDIEFEQQYANYGSSYKLPNVSQELINNISNIDSSKFVKFGGFIVNGVVYGEGTEVPNVTSQLNISINWVNIDSVLKFDLNLESMACAQGYDIVPATRIIKAPAQSFVFEDLPDLTGSDEILVNYTFVGWSTTRNGVGETYLAGEEFVTTNPETTLYAIYAAKAKTIILMANEVEIERIETKYNNVEVLNLKYPQGYLASNYTIEGYYNSSEFDGEIYNGKYRVLFNEETRTFYAKLTRITFFININANGGTGTIAPIEIVPENHDYTFTDEQKQNIKTAFSWQYHELVGLSELESSTTGSWKVNTKNVVNKQINLYVIWKIKDSEISAGFAAGYYPQTYVGLSLNQALTSEFNLGRLRETGQTYSLAKESGSFVAKEYSYQNNRYVKVDNVHYYSGYQSCVFTNGEDIVNGESYFFKVEPIKWDVFKKNNSYYVVSKAILGLCEFDDLNSNWATSSLRFFLNNTFRSEAKLGNFVKTISHKTTTYLSDEAGEEVSDSIFCLSVYELAEFYNLKYSSTQATSSSKILKEVTDLARATDVCSIKTQKNSGYYYLRSAGVSSAVTAYATPFGQIKNDLTIAQNYAGFVPAFVLAS